MSELTVFAPLSGWLETLDDSPDPVFRERVLGDGVSIDPDCGEVRAPFDGEVINLPDSRHAINLRADNGAEFLIHVGIDTVMLKGDGFEALVAPGDRVSAGQPLLRFDLDRVARKAASLRTPVLLLHAPGQVLEQLAAAGPVDFATPLLRMRLDENPVQAAQGDSGLRCSKTFYLGLEHGVHARPAATLLQALKPFAASGELRTADGKRAPLTSPVALMGLGLSCGDQIELHLQGADAEAALAALLPLLEPLDHAPPVVTHAPVAVALKAPAADTRLPALSASPGLAYGQAVRLERAAALPEQPPGTLAEESAALQQALATLQQHLETLVAQESSERAEVAAAHLALLQDPGLRANAEAQLASGAAAAWLQATEAAEQTLLQLPDPRMRERADDLRDLCDQLLRVLAGQAPDQVQSLPDKAIVLASNLFPSQLMNLDREQLQGVCLANGGATSHVAILAAAQGLPLLVAAGDEILAVSDGTALALDADRGELHVAPPAAATAAFEQRQARELASSEAARAAAGEPCTLQDGTRIGVHANLASLEEARGAVAAGAEGCGLLRTEFLFMARPSAPSVEAQREELQAIADALGDRPLVVRTLDGGADKPISYLAQDEEDNPALGVRGVRLSLANPGLLDDQLEALLRVESPRPLQVMLPMVNDAADLQAVRGRLDAVRARTGLERELALGVMIETPAAALLADQLATEADFFSIGTNDLAQYALSMDRLAPALARRLDPLHPAVLRLIAQTAQAGKAAGIEVGVCGAAAADTLAAPVLLGLGIRKLSMPTAQVARLKHRLRALDLARCEALAAEALIQATAADARARVRAALEP